LSALLHVAKHEEGIITVVVEVGSGKTLLSRLMISQLGARIGAVYLPAPRFSRDEILSAIARDLGLIDLPTSTETIHRHRRSMCTRASALLGRVDGLDGLDGLAYSNSH
jgi:type II secretory pathway predicted ATPase ExeA